MKRWIHASADEEAIEERVLTFRYSDDEAGKVEELETLFNSNNIEYRVYDNCTNYS